MNGILTTSMFLLFLFAAVSPVFPNPRPRKLHTRMLNSPIRESEMFETSNNVNGYDEEGKLMIATHADTYSLGHSYSLCSLKGIPPSMSVSFFSPVEP